jgi:hypothetical protein
MNKKFSRAMLMLAALTLSAVAIVAQDTTTKTQVVQNADGTWTVIEYPVGKEVSVRLLPSTTVTGATGTARVMRSADGTKVWVDVTGVPADTKTFYAYAVDPSGTPTLLGPVAFQNGVAKAEFSTPMNQFMVVLSPTQGLTTIEPTSTAFWSEAPQGYAVVPRRRTGDSNAVATALPTSSAYNVPLLNIPSFEDRETEVRINFTGELQGLDGKAYIDNNQGKTQVKMRFGDLKKAPPNKRFILWAASPDGKYTKLGQVVNTGKGDEGEIRSETAMKDFGLMVTVEDADVNTPTSRTYGTFRTVANP